ncbi:MAG: glutathione-disulfide reductase [Pseudomonadota bacterium]|nr:glutathione-disulfide reductase [Pseudomonadota bacterium]
MSGYDLDLFVIGAGSGGIRAARTAAELGARVAIAEPRQLGGTCVNLGCVPKKFLVYGARYRDDLSEAPAYGWSLREPAFDWGRLIANKDAQLARLRQHYERLLRAAGVTIIQGRARLVDAHTTAVDELRYSARFLLIATGSRPKRPDIPGQVLAVTSDEAFSLPRFPQRIVIVGGGYIAVEFAGIFNGMGAHTTLIHRRPLFLRGFDDDARGFLAEQMQKKGVSFRFDTEVSALTRIPGGSRVSLSTGEDLEADLVMYAIGRVPQVSGLGLDALGIARTESGAIVVNDEYRSSVPSVYAVGDVIDRVRLTPLAIAEGMAASRCLFGNAAHGVDYDNIPTAVFSQPELATVGLTEASARARFDKIKVYKTRFTPLKYTLSGRDERAFLKLIVAAPSDRVAGAHMVGPEASEVIQGIAIALKAGATKAVFDATLGIHPTLAEEFVTLRRLEA